MCGDGSLGSGDAAVILATILEHSLDVGRVDPENIRKMIKHQWGRIACLAHKIHDEETSEKKKLDRAIVEVECMSAASLRGVLAGIESEETTNLVKFYAKKVLEIK